MKKRNADESKLEVNSCETVGTRLSFKDKMKILQRRDLMGRAKPTWYRILAVIVVLIVAMVCVNKHQTKIWAATDPEIVPVAEDEIQLTFVGDVCLGRYVADYAEANGYSSLFADAGTLWENSDLVFANLECAVLKANATYAGNDAKSIQISASRTALKQAAKAGVDVVSVANNHVVDYGRKGLRHMLESVEEYGLTYAGAGENLEAAAEIKYIDVDGITVAFFAFSDILPAGFTAKEDLYGILPAEYSELYKQVSIAAETSDFVVVYVHWGEENEISIEADQESIGHQLIESGADIVIGSHPHVLQNIELYNDGIIFYSLGNFIFDQGTRDSRNTVMVQLNVNKDSGMGEFTLIPMRINNFHPCVTDSAFYISKIQASLTKGMDDSAYTITEDGRIHIQMNVFTPEETTEPEEQE